MPIDQTPLAATNGPILRIPRTMPPPRPPQDPAGNPDGSLTGSVPDLVAYTSICEPMMMVRSRGRPK